MTSRSPESNAKRSESMRNYWQNPENRAKHTAAIIEGIYQRSEEERSSDAKRSHSPESDAKRSETMREKWSDAEFRTKVGESLVECWDDPEYKSRNIEGKQRYWADPDNRSKRSESQKHIWNDPDSRNHIIDGQKQHWASLSDDEFERRVRVSHGRSKSPTDIERLVAAELEKRGIEFIPNDFMGRWELDLHVPSLKLDIQADGTYWHDSKIWPDRPAIDARHDAGLYALGYSVLRLSEDEIKQGDFTRLDEEISRLTK